MRTRTQVSATDAESPKDEQARVSEESGSGGWAGLAWLGRRTPPAGRGFRCKGPEKCAPHQFLSWPTGPNRQHFAMDEWAKGRETSRGASGGVAARSTCCMLVAHCLLLLLSFWLLLLFLLSCRLLRRRILVDDWNCSWQVDKWTLIKINMRNVLKYDHTHTRTDRQSHTYWNLGVHSSDPSWVKAICDYSNCEALTTCRGHLSLPSGSISSRLWYQFPRVLLDAHRHWQLSSSWAAKREVYGEELCGY